MSIDLVPIEETDRGDSRFSARLPTDLGVFGNRDCSGCGVRPRALDYRAE